MPRVTIDITVKEIKNLLPHLSPEQILKLKPGKSLQHTIKACIRKGEQYYFAECLEVPVITQDKTIDEVVTNFRD